MRPFDKAIIRLTILYSGILLAVCAGFSVAIYSGTLSHFEREPFSRLPRARIEVDNDIGMVIDDWMRLRDEEIQRQMLARLITLNVCVLVGGVFLSYGLARITLKPIDDNMKEQEQFVSNASHELRTPLNTMRMEIEVLQRDKNAQKDDYLELAESNLEEIDKLSAMCDRLLSLSHREKMEVAVIEVQEVVHAAQVEAAPAAERKKIKIIDKTAPAKITANRGALVGILGILLDNAIKYSPEKSRVMIANSGGKIMVSDEGPGVLEEDLPHIFERFYRAEKSHTTSGHGLGLPLAQHLAACQGMRVSAENNAKKGATFCVG